MCALFPLALSKEEEVDSLSKSQQRRKGIVKESDTDMYILLYFK